jgi:hypothetical protein
MDVVAARLPALLALTVYIVGEVASIVGVPEIPHVAVLKVSPVLAVRSGLTVQLVIAEPS